MTKVTVFYDGACPLCRREIEFYRERKGADGLAWVDVSVTDPSGVAPGLTKDQALTRFHVMGADGELVSGGAAFAAVWSRLRSFRLLGRVFRTWPLSWCLERAYDVFLKVRPALQRRAAKRHLIQNGDFPDWLVGELRSDHAGETGAVAIYRGILTVSRDAQVRGFSEAHLATEQTHVDLLNGVLPKHQRSWFLPLWRVAGFVTGALPAVFGARAVFATIDAVETFVDHHYAEQIERLRREDIHPGVRAMLERCRLDEVEHRDEARDALADRPGAILRAWCALVNTGSKAAVALARRV